MIPQAIRMAENAFRRYRTRDPYEIIDARNIKLRFFDEPKGLLGFYTVLNRKQIIGLNNSANEVQKRTGAIHELGHSLIDYRFAASGHRFEDFKFFSLSNAPSESNANLAGADLCISDDFILERIHYGQYQEVVEHINQHISQYICKRGTMTECHIADSRNTIRNIDRRKLREILESTLSN